MNGFITRSFSFIFALIFLFVSCSVCVFAENKSVTDDVQYYEISYKEALERYEKHYGEKVSLDGFSDSTVFDGCYGNQLDKYSKCMYDGLVSCIEKTKDGKTGIGATDFGEGDYYTCMEGKTYSDLVNEEWASVLYAIMAFSYDYSDVFWLDFGKMYFYMRSYDGKIWISLGVGTDLGYENYYCDGYTSADDVNADIEKMEDVYKKISDEVKDENIYNKLRYFNSYLVDSNEYNRFLSSSSDKRIWECVSALVYGSSDKSNTLNPVCEGYSRAMKFLCDKEGIDCVLVSGNNHMWNYVKMNDGKWYAVDTTWNDPIFSGTPSAYEIERFKYQYFLQGSTKFDTSHTADGNGVMYNKVLGVVYPVLNEDDYVYDPSVFETTTEESSSESSTEETSESSSEESSTDDEDISESSTDEETSESSSEESSTDESSTEESSTEESSTDDEDTSESSSEESSTDDEDISESSTDEETSESSSEESSTDESSTEESSTEESSTDDEDTSESSSEESSTDESSTDDEDTSESSTEGSSTEESSSEESSTEESSTDDEDMSESSTEDTSESSSEESSSEESSTDDEDMSESSTEESSTEDTSESSTEESSSDESSTEESSTEDTSESSTEESSSDESSTEESSTEDTSESSTEESSTEDTSESSTEESSTEDTSESSTEDTSNIIYGDVDGNGKIEVNDAVVLLKALLEDVLTDYQIKVGNLDKGNLEITAADVSYILQMALGNILENVVQP